ncbi:RIC3 acetylcholine receptor chaperone isoform X2 [Rhodnius prolixus]|uniref:RIC3 acetylcholine receptor chaperone isoform X2 n=1 Tax=Rhodnius prolixus TaxID=13249 RepID=UPI003D18F3C5
MATEFSTGKSVFILAIVAGCFAILWPNIFYPMLQGSYPSKDSLTSAQGGCCDVIFDNDVEAIKVMTDLCEKILHSSRITDSRPQHITVVTGKINAAMAEECREIVWQKCRVDITQVLASKSGLNRSYKQFLEELRSLNSSVCLKQSFGVSFGLIGLPRTIRIWGLNRSKHLRQERPPHLRPEFLHPALREKGRAIPHSHIVPKVDGRPPPMPGMRPPMGGAGHVVPPPKGSGTMGIVMPMYTIGIVVFFLYTMMKLMFKKTDSNGNYDSFTSDPDFHRAVFGDYNYSSNEEVAAEDATKLGWHERDMIVSAITGLVEEVNKQIRSDENLSSTLHETKEDNTKECDTPTEDKIEDFEIEETIDTSQTKGSVVKVVGYEMTESSSTGGKYSRPPTPSSRPATPASRPISPQPLYLPNLLPPQSQLLVSQEQTQTLPSEDNEEPVVLSAKVTLSLIGLPDEDSSNREENASDDLHSSKPKFDLKIKDECTTNGGEVNNTIENQNNKLVERSNSEDYEIAEEKFIDGYAGPTHQEAVHVNTSKI